MTPFTIIRVDALPELKVPNALYIVRTPQTDQAKLTFTGDNPSVVAHTVSVTDVRDMIATALTTHSSVYVFNTYQDMMAMIPSANSVGFLRNANGIPGNPLPTATFIFDKAIGYWAQAQDSINWNKIIGRPTATVAQIDSAVAKAHTHLNMAVLDKLSETGEQKLTYNGALVSNVEFSAEW